MPRRFIAAALALAAIGCTQPVSTPSPAASIVAVPLPTTTSSAPSAPSPSALPSPSGAPTASEGSGSGANPPVCGDATLVGDGERLLLVTCVSQVSPQQSEQVWTWDGSAWSIVDEDGPSPLVVTSAAYDTERSVLVRYGGLPSDSNDCVAETWEWDGTDWRLAAAADDDHPTACDHMKMVYDVGAQQTLLIGGGDEDTNLITETWGWDAAGWSVLLVGGPVGRAHHGLVYDASHRQTLLYGGYDGTSVFDDFWSWDGLDWTQLNFPGPGPRSHHGLAISTDAELLLFGGATGPLSFETMVADTWLLTGGSWTELDVEGPSARLSPALGYDATRQVWVLYGGFGAHGSELGDTWEFDGTTWDCVRGCEG